MQSKSTPCNSESSCYIKNREGCLLQCRIIETAIKQQLQMQSIYSADFLLEIYNSECAYKWFYTPRWHCLYEFSTFWTEFSTLFNHSGTFYILFVWKSIYCDLSFITHNKKCLVKKNKNSSRQDTVENLLQTAPKGQNGIHYIIF